LFGCGCILGAEKGFWRPAGGFFFFFFVVSPRRWLCRRPYAESHYDEVCSGEPAYRSGAGGSGNTEQVGFKANLLKSCSGKPRPPPGHGPGPIDHRQQYRSAIVTRNAEPAQPRPSQRPPTTRASSRPQVLEKSPRRSWDRPFFFAETHHQHTWRGPGSRPYCFRPAQRSCGSRLSRQCLPLAPGGLGKQYRLVALQHCVAAQLLTPRNPASGVDVNPVSRADRSTRPCLLGCRPGAQPGRGLSLVGETTTAATVFLPQPEQGDCLSANDAQAALISGRSVTTLFREKPPTLPGCAMGNDSLRLILRAMNSLWERRPIADSVACAPTRSERYGAPFLIDGDSFCSRPPWAWCSPWSSGIARLNGAAGTTPCCGRRRRPGGPAPNGLPSRKGTLL